MSSSSSPLKRSASQINGNDPKRVKAEDTLSVDDILNDDFESSMSAFDSKDPLLQIPQIDSSLPSGSVSAMDTPTLMDMELQAENAQTPSQASSQFPGKEQTNQGNHNNSDGNNPNNPNPNPNNRSTVGDPEKLSDALLSAGVDLKAEEALLNSTINALPTKQPTTSNSGPQGPIILSTPFLDPRQLHWFMNKIVVGNGLKHTADLDSSVINLMTYATEEWMKNLLTNAVILSRHRRRGIRNRKRSELSVAIRDLSMQAKAQEDRRQELKRMSGMDKTDDKEATEETQHKATNATVAMMTGKKKKYDWMNSGGGAAKNTANEGAARFREAREEPGLVVRDLLNSLEKKRVGVEKTIAKGYAKLRD